MQKNETCHQVLDRQADLLSHVLLFVTAEIVSYQAPLSLEFSRQEYWSGLPFPSPGHLPQPLINLDLLQCRQILYYLSHQGRPSNNKTVVKSALHPAQAGQ